jgi:hypothetical protein
MDSVGTSPIGTRQYQAQRLFFWDDSHAQCGVILLAFEACQPFSYIMKLSPNDSRADLEAKMALWIENGAPGWRG